METDWMSVVKCKELSPTIFFPSDGVGVQAAQRICAECPVADACLQYALDDRVDHAPPQSFFGLRGKHPGIILVCTHTPLDAATFTKVHYFML